LREQRRHLARRQALAQLRLRDVGIADGGERLARARRQLRRVWREVREGALHHRLQHLVEVELAVLLAQVEVDAHAERRALHVELDRLKEGVNAFAEGRENRA